MISGYRIEKWNKPHDPNSASLRYEMEKEGFRVMHWCDRPGLFYGKHKHNEDQSHWVISGIIEICIGNISYELSAGDRDHIPAGTYHSARVVGKEPVVYLIGEKIALKQSSPDSAVSETFVDNLMKMERMLAEYAGDNTDKDEKNRDT